MKVAILYILRTTLILLTVFYFCGCKEEGHGGSYGDANIYLTVRASATSINTDQVFWEDRVDELRMLVFDIDDGSVVFNEKLYFPDGFNARSRSVRIPPGTYDFYFIANESVQSGDFVTALLDISNRSEFDTDTRFLDIPYDPTFEPDGSTPQGRFLMSAVYQNITVADGGTETNPVALPLPTTRVELIRSMAKVEVVFRKKVPGSAVPENTVTSVRLANVASYYSVPPEDDYYAGQTRYSEYGPLDGLDYANDSIGAVVFYAPEFLVPVGSANHTELQINNNIFPIENDVAHGGLAEQRRTVPAVSDNSVIRNYHYTVNAYINAEGGVQIEIFVEPWQKDGYVYIFQGDQNIVIPPVIPTDSSIIIPTECGKVEILSHNEQLSSGLQGAYNADIIYYDPNGNYPRVDIGDPPYYCEAKYGEGWRLINSCELMSFLAYFDKAYTVWLSNTWLAQTHGNPYYPLHFRQEAQALLENLTGFDLSSSVLYPTNNWSDVMADEKLDIIDRYFTPGDILLKEEDFPGGWPYAAPPATGSGEQWFYNEAAIQVKAFWYGGDYLSPSIRDNWDRILYGEFERFNYSSTVSRCVRTVL